MSMVEKQIVARGVHDPAVLAAMQTIPRHEFVPKAARDQAYQDHPVPIGYGQTVSQPYIVAVMSELAQINNTSNVLEIGTGSGYQTAVLAALAAEVYTIEIVPPLAKRAQATLKRLGVHNVHFRTGDGTLGWPECAPFDAIVVTAAPPRVPGALVEQLTDGGRMVIPVGTSHQELRIIHRQGDQIVDKSVFPVRFVPMTRQPRA